MSANHERWPSEPGVRQMLASLLAGVQAILQDEFIGLYLSGSLAAGDFDPHTSDIDFLVVTRAELSAAQLAGLDAMHQRLLESSPQWGGELEGSYISLGAIRRHQHPPSSHPHLERGLGTLRVEPHDNDWIIHRYIIRSQGVALAGPPPAQLIDPVTPAELKQAVGELLFGWWEPMLAEPFRLEHLGYRYYAVQTMCRTLYTLEFGTVVSKAVAARWATAQHGSRWVPLIDESFAWPRVERLSSFAETLDFIRYTLDYYRSC